MIEAYYELEDDLYYKGRWYLRSLCDRNGIELDGREFRYGNVMDLSIPLNMPKFRLNGFVEAQLPLKMMLDPKRPGVPLDFTFSNEDVPVVTTEVAELLESIAGADIQRVPILIESQKNSYEIINVVSVVDCINAKRSEIMWWEEGNSIRPDLVGTPEMVRRLVVDLDRVGSHHVLRLKGWKLPIIVSNVMKQSLEEAKVSGITFRQVSP